MRGDGREDWHSYRTWQCMMSNEINSGVESADVLCESEKTKFEGVPDPSGVPLAKLCLAGAVMCKRRHWQGEALPVAPERSLAGGTRAKDCQDGSWPTTNRHDVLGKRGKLC